MSTALADSRSHSRRAPEAASSSKTSPRVGKAGKAQSNRIVIHFDGSCEPRNPGGVATCGWVTTWPSGDRIEGHRVVAEGPGATNNVAEWEALRFALEELLGSTSIGDEKYHELTGMELVIYGDSKLVIEQLNGRWQCKSPVMADYCCECQGLLDTLGIDWSAEWVPREQNHDADSLSRKAYEQHTGKRYPERSRR